MSNYYPFMRDLQSRLGPLISLKVAAQREIRRIQKKPFEREFEILAWLDVGERCLMDIGGNRGQSLDAMRLFQPKCVIHSFEPNVDLANQLVKRFGKDRHIHIHNHGLGDTALKSPLYIPYYRKFMYDGLASFVREEAIGWLNEDTVWRFDPRLLHVKETVCRIVVADRLNLRPALIKIDVQGFEVNVLAGAGDTVQAHKPIILMENNSAGEAWLLAKGWRAMSYADGRLKDGSGDNNTLYFHPDSPEHTRIMTDYI